MKVDNPSKLRILALGYLGYILIYRGIEALDAGNWYGLIGFAWGCCCFAILFDLPPFNE